MRRFLLTLVAVLTMGATVKGQLIINELMQSNVDCVMDDLNEFPDSWVELYNTSSITHLLRQGSRHVAYRFQIGVG